MALARDVGGDLHAIREAHARDLAERRVRLLRRGRVDPGANTAALGRGDPALATLTRLQAGGRDLPLRTRAALSYELSDAWHATAKGSRGLCGRQRSALSRVPKNRQ